MFYIIFRGVRYGVLNHIGRSTCFNTLKLPFYGSARELKEKVLYAISSKSGFDLS